MTVEPNVTVIIPISNEEKHIEETIKSALNQSHTKLLVHVSNNASTDDSLKILEKLSRKDSRLRLTNQKQHISASENFQYLIDNLNTPFAMFLGGHDLLSEDYIDTCLKGFTHGGVACVYSKAKLFGEANAQWNPNSDIALDSNDRAERYLKLLNNLGNGTAVYSLFRTSVLKKTTFYSIAAADMAFLFQIAKYGSIVSIDETKYFRREDRIETEAEKRKGI